MSSFCFQLLSFLSYFLPRVDCIREFYFDLTSRTWTEAMQYCNEYHDGLATISTKQQLSDATYDIPVVIGSSINHVWIGLNDRDAEGSWRWHGTLECIYNVSGGGHDCSDFWLDGEPNNRYEAEDCGQLWFYKNIWKFNDANCNNSMPTLCNKKKEFIYVWNGTFMNWTDSEIYCNNNHGGMATIQSSNDYINAISIIPSGVTHLWIGLNDIDIEDEWQWSHGDKCLSDDNTTHDCSAYWKADEPNNAGHESNEDCAQLVYMDESIWMINDYKCNAKLGVLCLQADATSHPTSQPTPDVTNWKYSYSGGLYEWADALIYCEETYVGLATLLTEHDIELVTSLLPTIYTSTVNRIWIGLNDVKQTGQWEWSDDTECNINNNSCSDLWAEGEPDWDEYRSCAVLHYVDSKWSVVDQPCDSVNPVFCGKEGSTLNPTINPTNIPTINPSINPTNKPTLNPLMYSTINNIINNTNDNDNSGNSNKKRGSSSINTMDVILIVIILCLLIGISFILFYLFKFKKMYKRMDELTDYVGNSSIKHKHKNTENMDMNLVPEMR